nr:hypothetical protein [Psychrobacter sp. PraFG1]UNK06380.1 hypothetical protein MN210_07610 [Psychrobacter sp. PraFG1]
MTLAVELLSKPGEAIPGFVLIAAALGLLLMYVRHARKAGNPIFPLSLFDVRTFRIGITGNLFTRLGISAVPIYYRYCYRWHLNIRHRRQAGC